MPQTIQIFFHLVLFALWLGAHVAVLVLLWQLRAARESTAERARVVRAMAAVERVPRAAFVLMLPMGLQLAETRGLFQLGGMGALGAWIVAAVWLVAAWFQPRHRRTDTAVGVRTAQRVLMVVVAVVMAGAGLLSLLSGAPVAAGWLAAKFILYGVSLLAILGIELVTQDVLYAAAGPGLRPAPPLDEALAKGLPRATAFAVLLYACLLGASYAGLARSF